MADEVREGFTIDRLLSVLSRRKWLAVATFVAPLAAAVSGITFLPNVYRSTATVIVDRQQVPESLVQSTVTSALETRLQTISQEILSRSRLEALINRFGLYADMRKRAQPEEVTERMRRDIKLELKGVEARGREATVAFTLGFRGHDPITVSLVTNTLASFYIEENLKARERQATGTAQFMRVQLEDTKKRLDELERRVSDFKRRHMGELPQQMDANLATLERLQAQLRLNQDNQTRATERRQTLSNQLAEAETLLLPSMMALSAPTTTSTVAPDAPSPGPPGEYPEARLARLKEDLAKLRTRFNDKYPDVIALKAEIGALERQVAEAKKREAQEAKAHAAKKEPKPEAPKQEAVAPPRGAPLTPYVLRLREALSEAQADIKVYKGEERRLRDSIAAYQTRVENVPRREQEFRELSRDYDSTSALYQSLLKRYEEAQLAESLEQRQKGEQFRVIEPAIPNPRPAAPNRMKLLLVALVGSIALAAGVVALVENVDTSFHGVGDLRAFSPVPVLVSIPRIATDSDRRRQRRRMWLATSAAVVGLFVIVVGAYFVAHGNEHLVTLLDRTS